MTGVECTKFLLEEAKVGVVPGLMFYFADGGDLDRPLIRLAICKKRETIEEASRRIQATQFPSVPPPR
ncbi:unnamed protein product [Discosporangium mesarthrocarpum]